MPRRAPARSRQILFQSELQTRGPSHRFRKNRRRRVKSSLPNRVTVSIWLALKVSTSVVASCQTKQHKTVCDNQRESHLPRNCCDSPPSVWFATRPAGRGHSALLLPTATASSRQDPVQTALLHLMTRQNEAGHASVRSKLKPCSHPSKS